MVDLNEKRVWLITGVAGFIGSNLLETLLKLNQKVVGLDNFATGFQKNLSQVKELVTQQQWANFNFIDGDICDFDICSRCCQNVDYILHQAALGSVPRSIKDPIATNKANVDGFLNMLIAARDRNVRRFVYASSSSVYGDHPDLPKIEYKIGKPLSPYAVTKYANELYAQTFSDVYGLETIGLRYFNVFGARQNPNGAYAAVIPKWIAAMIRNEPVHIFGDGLTSRDFCYVENAVQANLLAALTENKDAINQIYNIACGDKTNLNQLFQFMHENLIDDYPHLKTFQPIYQDFRKGDVLHSLADIKKAQLLLGYEPRMNVEQGLIKALDWYKKNA